MSEYPIAISNLNDFVFCPVSIYFHSLDHDTEKLTYQDDAQLNGTAAHEAIDAGRYSDRKSVWQAVPVYSTRYGLFGKIDLFDADSGLLTERKKKIVTVYDGYVFQLYAQYFALCEMGCDVRRIRLFSMDYNKAYPIRLPEEDEQMPLKFERLIDSMKSFDLNGFRQTNPLKCGRCIYEPLCSFSCQKSEGEEAW